MEEKEISLDQDFDSSTPAILIKDLHKSYGKKRSIERT